MLSTITNLDEYARCLQEISVPVCRVNNDITEYYQVQWDIARLDLLDKEMSGNKLFKLLPFLLQAKSRGITQLLSFGGMHSNHLHALAYAGKRFGFDIVAIVRGYADQSETPTLEDLRNLGVQVVFAGKTEYLQRNDSNYLQLLQSRFPAAFIIPEGGAHSVGIEGASLMAHVVRQSLEHVPDIVAMAMGTGTSFAGVLGANVFGADCELRGYSALANADELTLAMQKKAGAVANWKISDDYCGGGFASMDKELAIFIECFEAEQGIPLDPVYTAKLCFAIHSQIKNGHISAGSKVLALHTGGLQGRRGMHKKIERYCIGEQTGKKYQHA